jgi:hypothetical protein
VSHIENRTLGEIAAMRDTLLMAREEVVRSSSGSDPTGAALIMVIDVLNAIVQGTPFMSTPHVHRRVGYKPGRKV